MYVTLQLTVLEIFTFTAVHI